LALSSLLAEDRIHLEFQSKDKWEAIRKMVEQLSPLPEGLRRSVLDALVAREKVSSTGLEQGVAIPHATVDGVGAMQISLAVCPAGVPFDSSDGRPANLIALLLIPRSEARRYTATLAHLARLLTQDQVRESILRARGRGEVLEVIRERERTGAGAS